MQVRVKHSFIVTVVEFGNGAAISMCMHQQKHIKTTFTSFAIDLIIPSQFSQSNNWNNMLTLSALQRLYPAVFLHGDITFLSRSCDMLTSMFSSSFCCSISVIRCWSTEGDGRTLSEPTSNFLMKV